MGKNSKTEPLRNGAQKEEVKEQSKELCSGDNDEVKSIRSRRKSPLRARKEPPPEPVVAVVQETVKPKRKPSTQRRTTTKKWTRPTITKEKKNEKISDRQTLLSILGSDSESGSGREVKRRRMPVRTTKITEKEDEVIMTIEEKLRSYDSDTSQESVKKEPKKRTSTRIRRLRAKTGLGRSSESAEEKMSTPEVMPTPPEVQPESVQEPEVGKSPEKPQIESQPMLIEVEEVIEPVVTFVAQSTQTEVPEKPEVPKLDPAHSLRFQEHFTIDESYCEHYDSLESDSGDEEEHYRFVPDSKSVRPKLTTILDLTQDIPVEMPKWSAHAYSANSYCFSLMEEGPTCPIVTKSIIVDPKFRAQVFINSKPIDAFDGIYNSYEALRQLVHDVDKFPIESVDS